MALAIITNLYILEQGDPPHRYLGYAVVGTVFLRLLYGLIKNDYTSIKNFPLSIKNLKVYLTDKLKHKDNHYVGHNPAASVVYVLMWALVVLLGLSGFMMGTDFFFGEDWVQDSHELFSILMQILIVSHFVGMAMDYIQFKKKTWLKMFKG